MDARSTDGIEHLLSHFQCDFVVRSAPIGDHGIYALVWAKAQVGIQLQLEHGRRGIVMWRARHVATRSEGGLPLTPVGAVVNAFWAAQFQADREEIATLIDKAVRRIMRTFPSVKRVIARGKIINFGRPLATRQPKFKGINSLR